VFFLNLNGLLYLVKPLLIYFSVIIFAIAFLFGYYLRGLEPSPTKEAEEWEAYDPEQLRWDSVLVPWDIPDGDGDDGYFGLTLWELREEDSYSGDGPFEEGHWLYDMEFESWD